MRIQTAFVVAVAFASAGVASAQNNRPAPQTDDQKALYAAGAVLAQNVAGWNLKPEEIVFVVQGLEDAAGGKKLAVDLDTMKPQISAFAQARATATAEAEKKASQPFLDKAAAEKGAKKTESGLVLTQVKAGTGPSPKAEDKVKVHYHGTLMDGTVFDSSVERKEPVTFPLKGVIPCWTEALQLMKVGEKAKLTCPAAIAYGDRGAPPRIKPGAVLTFEVDLLSIEPPTPAAAVPPPAPPKP